MIIPTTSPDKNLRYRNDPRPSRIAPTWPGISGGADSAAPRQTSLSSGFRTSLTPRGPGSAAMPTWAAASSSLDVRIFEREYNQVWQQCLRYY